MFGNSDGAKSSSVDIDSGVGGNWGCGTSLRELGLLDTSASFPLVFPSLPRGNLPKELEEDGSRDGGGNGGSPSG